ncbi:hypothetical protein QR680_017436 [Steinernema hermaphroditum]|uniref:Uncharacterized protein n=1 Tax=Steinernema hermaphroditum TaxID=289476 RepID=A0AA39HEJ3_9BILA|nr:hypothetical protein QR680_017436 [Steinernema hermaphroditum]
MAPRLSRPVYRTTYRSHASLSAVPSIDHSRNDVKPRVIEGRPVTLWCDVSGYPFPSVRWSKNGVEVDVDGERLRLLDGGQGLEILEAAPEDAGQWMCTAENDAGATELVLTLDVWMSPSIAVTTHEGRPSAIQKAGSPVTLLCNASGNPTPALSWSFAGQLLISSPEGPRISSKGARLDIPHLKENDAGEYTCLGRNEVGSVEASIDVDILIPPLINRNQIDLTPRIPTGRSLTLVCEASGKPTPRLSWSFEGAPLTKSSGAVFSGQAKYLQLRNISLADKGVYRCRASSEAGEDELVYKLDVDQIPSIQNGGTVQVVEGAVTEMECRAQGEPRPVVTWQRNGVRVETGDRYIAEGDVLKVIDTRTADSGIYVCVATNEAGIDQQAFTLEVLVPPRITDTSPAESMVPVGSPFSLKCGASGSPPPEISWFINEASIESVYPPQEFTLAEEGTLFIPRPAERGVLPFKCVARNDAGVDEIEYAVKVIMPPTVSRDGLHTLNITEGDKSVLLCQIQGEKSNIVWRKDNEALQMTPRMSVSNGGANLEINDTKLHDEGLYTCIAENSAGNATQNIQLFVGVPPKISEKSRRVVVRKGQNAELWCEAVGIPPPQISWLKNSDALEHMAINDRTESIQTTAIFTNVSIEDAGIYTCTAKNWAGSVYKDYDLNVLTPPEIFPEKANLTARPGDTVILPCNASGIPEPVVSWVKIPDVDISGNAEKYQLLGTALAIRNVGAEDDGFYHCIAKSDAGQVIGSRRLVVALPTKEQKIHWVECDENEKPVKKTYVPARGDNPQGTLLPWATTDFLDLPVNGTDGVLVRCLPGIRGPRRVPLLSAPQFVDHPRSHTVVVGQVLQLYCSASGTPEPEISWLRDDAIVASASSGEGSSLLRLEVIDESAGGAYTCVARNSLGTATTMASVTVIPKPKKKTVPERRRVTVMRCSVEGRTPEMRPEWVVDGRRIGENEGVHLVHAMHNGSLVLLRDATLEDDASVVECFVDGRRGVVAVTQKVVEERAPKAVIRPARIYSRPGKTILVDCRVKFASPLTTQVRWTRDNVNLPLDDERVRVLANNSLWIAKVHHTDQASYKCRAANALGKSWDGVDVIVDDGARGTVGLLEGVVNSRRLTHQNLITNVTPSVGFNTIHMKIDNLFGNQDTVTKAIVGYMAAPVGFLGHDPLAPRERASPARGAFERVTEYRFETGETINVLQKGKGVQPENSHLEVDVLLNGNVPRPIVMDALSFEDSVEELIEEVPGKITGRGKSALHFGDRHRIPFEWSDQINYDPTEGMEIGAGKTMRVAVKSNFEHDELQMHTKVERDERCPEGFHKIRGYCKDIDECAMDEEICGEAGCQNTVGGYECERQCPAGFKAKWDGSCVDVDECSLGTAACPYETECLNTIGSFKCLESCAAGYALDDDDHCQDMDECAATPSPCAAPMSCRNTLGSYRCVCPAGFPVVDGRCLGIGAETERPLKTMAFDAPSGGDCPPGFHWTGFVCEDVDECAFDAPCQFDCLNTPGSFSCSCPDGYVLDDSGKCTDVDECAVGVCAASQLCLNELGSFKCLNSPCPPGYHLNNLRCVSTCANCSHPPIAIHMLAVTRRLPQGTPLLRLTSYDQAGRVLHRTRYSLAPKARSLFALLTERGRATLLSAAKLPPASRHSVGIRSFSDADAKKYHSEFLVLLSVSKEAPSRRRRACPNFHVLSLPDPTQIQSNPMKTADEVRTETMEERWLRVRTEDVDVPVEAADGAVVFSSVQSAIPGAHGLYYRENGVKKALKYDSLTGKVSMPASGWDAHPIFVEIAHAHGCKSKGYLDNYEAATKTFEQSVNMVHRLLAGAARSSVRRTPVAKAPLRTEDAKETKEGDAAQISAAEHENLVNQEMDRMQAYKMQKLIEENAHLRDKLNECRIAMENFDRQLRSKNDELRSLNAMFMQSGSVLESIEREKALLEGNLREYKTWLFEANHRIKGLELENEELAMECKQRCNSIDDHLLHSATVIPQRSVYSQKSRPLSPTSFFNTHSAQLAAMFPPGDKETKPLDSTEKLRRLKEHFTLRQTRREIYHHCWTPPETGAACGPPDEKASPTKDSVSISETTESTIPVGEDKTIEEKVKRLEAVTSSMLQQNSEIQKNQIRIKKRVKDVLGKIGPTPGAQEAPGNPAHSDSSDTTPQGADKEEEPLKVAPIESIKTENLTAADWKDDNVEMSGKFCVISGTPEIDKNRLNLVVLNQKCEPSSEHRRVWFEIDAPDAKDVYLAGSFLNWEYALLCERRAETNSVGAWLDLLPGRYEFRFLVDGEWRTVDAYEKTELNVHGARNNWRFVE